LKSCYQSFTQADMTALRQAGYSNNFLSLEQGLENYYKWYDNQLSEYECIKA